MYRPKEGMHGLRKKKSNKGKAKFNIIETTCVMLAQKLYENYTDALSKSQGVEAENFAEAWMARILDGKDYLNGKDKVMDRAIWRHFMSLLIEHRKGRDIQKRKKV